MQQSGAPVRVSGPRIKAMSAQGLTWLASLEGGCKLKTYRDSAGIPTIGVGCTWWPTTPTRKRVEMGDSLPSVAEGMLMFRRVLRDYEATVDACTHDAIKQEMFDALTSLCYNIGQTAFAGSTVVKRLNAGAPLIVVAAEIRRWNRAAGAISEGLVERRECEADLLLYGCYRTQGKERAA